MLGYKTRGAPSILVDTVFVMQFEERAQSKWFSRQLYDHVYLKDFLEVRWWDMIAFYHHFQLMFEVSEECGCVTVSERLETTCVFIVLSIVRTIYLHC